MKRPIKVVAASQFYELTSLKKHKSPSLASADDPSLLSSRNTQPALRFNPLNAPYKTFKTQKEAFKFLDGQPCAQILRTFAAEVSETGQRVFIVTSAELFWQHYKQLPAKERHHYEIIRQSTPCNLYFDLEFCPATNPGVDGPALVELLVYGIAQQLQQLYDIPWHDSYALELDSSTPQKFSRHLIVKLPGLAFSDACHAGRFARLVLLRLLQQGCSRCCQLLVRPKEGDGLTTFVDMAVYTRNRAFRLYLSSKYGKQACLRLTNRFGGARRDPQAAYKDLLVSVLHKSSNSRSGSGSSRAALAQLPVEGETQQWGQQQQQQQQQMAVGSSSNRSSSSRRHCAPGAAARPVSLLQVAEQDWQQELQQLPAAWQQVAMLQLNPLPHNSQEPLPGSPHSFQQQCWQQQQQQRQCVGRAVAWPQQAAAAAVVCHGPSPYPLLEHFITTICVQGGVQGEVRSWAALPGCVTFHMKNNRWCGNVGRAHKSNGVYYVADLEAGTYYQKCFDPECRSYRSNCMPLPAVVWEKYRQQPADRAAKGQQHSTPQCALPTAGSATAMQAPLVKQQQQQARGSSSAPGGLQPSYSSKWESKSGQELAAEGAGEEEEDALCLQLLLQFDQHSRQQQRQQFDQHLQQQQRRQQFDQHLQQQQQWLGMDATIGTATQSDCMEGCVDEDDMCLQLLEEFERDAADAACCSRSTAT